MCLTGARRKTFEFMLYCTSVVSPLLLHHQHSSGKSENIFKIDQLIKTIINCTRVPYAQLLKMVTRS